MANRWSPTVIAEAPPPTRSMLATALKVAMPLWEQRRQERLAAEKAAVEQARYDDELAYRNRAEQRGIASEQRSIVTAEEARKVAAAQRLQDLRDKGYSDTRPTYNPPLDMMATPAWNPDVDDVDRGGAAMTGFDAGANYGQPAAQGPRSFEPKAGNTGEGGADSQSQKPWVVAAEARIRREAEENFGHSESIVTVIDPVTGTPMYKNPRREFIKAQKAELQKQIDAARVADEAAARAREQAVMTNDMSHNNAIDLAGVQHGYRMQENAAEAARKAAEKKEGGLPDSVKMRIAQDNVAVMKLKEAMAMVKQHPNALGLKTLFPAVGLNIFDKAGVPTRAALQAAIVDFRRSNFGLAVSKYEAATGAHLLPADGDGPEQVLSKLDELLNGSEIHRRAIMEIYGQEYTPLGQDSPENYIGGASAALPSGGGSEAAASRNLFDPRNAFPTTFSGKKSTLDRY